MDFETEKFVDHFRANGEARADWVAGWRNWIRRELGYQQRDAAKGQNRPGQPARASPQEIDWSPEAVEARDRAHFEQRAAAGDLRAAKALERMNTTGESR